MAFSPVPKESKKQINKAGQILRSGSVGSDTFQKAITLANKWRACHAYPINTFNSTLRRKIKKFSGDTIVAQRLKRMQTIIDKLKRFPHMQLTTMQDIGGVRAVMNSVNDVYKLADEYRDKSRFTHELVKEDDYIKNPRSEDNYRSLHLIYKYKNNQAMNYNGLFLELQIRTKLQHIWATAVETMSTFLGQALKSRQGDRAWIDFFALVSSAFAYKEKTAIAPRFKDKTQDEIYLAVAEANDEIKAIEKMKGYSVAVEVIFKKGDTSWSYHLIVLNSLEHRVQIRPYKRGGFQKALIDYANVEKRAVNGEKIEPALVSAGKLTELRQAYPNFFLDIGDFVKRVEGIISMVKSN